MARLKRISSSSPGSSSKVEPSTHEGYVSAILKASKKGNRRGNVIFLSDTLVAKECDSNFTESETLRFIAARTSIPVPRVIFTLAHNAKNYVIMERIDGQTLNEAWNSLSPPSRSKILGQVKAVVEEMRELVPEDPRAVCSVNGGPLFDSRLPNCDPKKGFGPFKSVQEFHTWLHSGTPSAEQSAGNNSGGAKGSERVVFTHGDVNPLNILVKGDEVVGFIDWEFAGWYPYYWEYTATYRSNSVKAAWLWEAFEQTEVVGHFPKELETERERVRMWGEM
ncbi:aminoglycoside phosphotransferase [Diplogelasinospora grovesii]|uniref:Aminoglycoside phosphotransferase n=1 Tax=Diplogelasinospora grovesii TaxID=303347 RepID=A0AAN6N0M4_9PEZI|nr:aminoglycoside phosphotransferase [Diplogelasinospora grovesii]